MPNLSRRHLVTTAAALPVLAVPVLASETIGPSHPDADLIALGDELESLWPEFVAARDAFNEEYEDDGPAALRYEAIDDQVSEVAHAIIEMPSHTLAGLRAKLMASIHAADCYFWGIPFDDLDGDHRGARSLMEAVCVVTGIDLAKHLGVELS